MPPLIVKLIDRLGYVYFKHRFQPYGLDLCTDLEQFAGGSTEIRTVFDVGTNVGQSARAYARHFPNAWIFSFEPIKATFADLCTNCRSNLRIEPHQMALGATVGRVRIFNDPVSVLNKVLREPRSLDGLPTEEVDQSTVSDFAAKHGLDHIDFIKTDLEGYDLDGLKGAEPLLARKAIRFVLSEVTFNSTSAFHTPFGHVSACLAEFGFKFVYVYDGDFSRPPGGCPALCSANALFGLTS